MTLIGATEAAKVAQAEVAKLSSLELVGVRGLSQDDGKWHVTVELVEKKSIPDGLDLLGGYEVIIDEEGKVTGFERKTLRRRGDLDLREV